jgi:hypothetical protein
MGAAQYIRKKVNRGGKSNLSTPQEHTGVPIFRDTGLFAQGEKTQTMFQPLMPACWPADASVCAPAGCRGNGLEHFFRLFQVLPDHRNGF